MQAIYKLDLTRYGLELLPLIMRKSRIVALVRAFTRPLHKINADFAKQREQARYALGHTGQVCYLQSALNDKFDTVDRRIYISELIKYSPVYFAKENEKKIVCFGKEEVKDRRVLFAKQETIGQDAVDFVVNVPRGLNVLEDFKEDKDKEQQLRLFVDRYKLVSKRYSINIQ